MKHVVEIVKNVNLYGNNILSPDKLFFSIANINDKYNPSIKSSIFQKLGAFSNKQIQPIYEDIIVIALSVFALDKRFARHTAYDAWTREFKINVPVLCYEKWNSVKEKIERMLSFLSGDIWVVEFSSTTTRITYDLSPTSVDMPYTHVSLFSGGLDSFCGAIRMLEDRTIPLFVGNEEYPKLEGRQGELVAKLRECYPSSNFSLQTFTAKALAAKINSSNYTESENTSRTRSLLFLAAALCFAGLISEDMPVLIPENGFIGLNSPLTPSRMGSCSTRTTHPWFLRELNAVLQTVGIKNPIINPFKLMSKTEVVHLVENTKAFQDCYNRTISCSHPTNPKWKRKEYPMNCGYCYPCLIRRSSLSHLDDLIDKYDYDIDDPTDIERILGTDKQNDLLATLTAANNFKNNGQDYLRKQLANSGLLLKDEIDPFVDLYSATITDFISIISNEKLKDFAGL